jgi:hypothetical protein
MSPAPFEVPIKASEAAVLADITFQLLDNRRLQEDLRNRLAARAAGMGLTSVRPYWGSLQQDPVHASSYYLAVDALAKDGVVPLLLRMALASSPASALFPKAMLIGRMRPGGGREVVVNAASFGPADTAAIDTFATKVDRAFLPRPLASSAVLSILSSDPESDYPAMFEGLRLVQRAGGVSAAFIAAPGMAARTLAAAVWSAIRAGWRDGYGLEADLMPLKDPALETQIHEHSVFTRFRAVLSEGETTLDSGPEFAHHRFTVGDTVYEFAPPETTILQSRLGASLLAAEKFFATVRSERLAAGFGRAFDFEVVPPPTGSVRTAFFCQHWLKSRGCPVTLIAPSLHSVEEAKQHGSVARHFGSTLSFDEEVLARLPNPTQWTGNRWNCRLKGKLSAARIQAAVAALRS